MQKLQAAEEEEEEEEGYAEEEAEGATYAGDADDAGDEELVGGCRGADEDDADLEEAYSDADVQEHSSEQPEYGIEVSSCCW